MITFVRIDGFKSLQKFTMRLNNGLNVLIGPNGAGKSNICQALGLIASAAEDQLTNYILSLGGVSSVFTIKNSEGVRDKPTLMKVFCKGEKEIKFQGKLVKIYYRYRITLSFLKNITIKSESLVVECRFKKRENKVPVFIVKRKANSNTIKVEKLNRTDRGQVYLFEDEGVHNYDLRTSMNSLLNPASMLDIAFGEEVRNDMFFSKAWNIDPHIAKKNSDLIES